MGDAGQQAVVLRTPFEGLIAWFRDSTWFQFGVPVALALLVIGVALLWLSSRGKLIFLDNMIQERAAFVDPWKRFRRLGD